MNSCRETTIEFAEMLDWPAGRTGACDSAEELLRKLALCPDVENAPLVVDADAPLASLSEGLVGRTYIVAVDRRDRTAGIVTARSISERLQASHSMERLRWGRMPVRSLLNFRFACGGEIEFCGAETLQPCAPIRESGRLLAIATEADLFVSWERLQSLLTNAWLDPLTGLFNRGAFERRLNEEWARAARGRFSVAVVVIDIDYFKEFNDVHGHAAGDEILCTVARALERSFRSYDIVARYGGDEFVAICLGCGPGEIELPIHRVARHLAEVTSQYSVASGRLSASIGAAVRHGGFQDTNPQELFVAADKCLYCAKSLRETAFRIEVGTDERSGREVVPVDVAY